MAGQKHCIALILAAGDGVRMGKQIPKQYLLLNGRSLLRYSLETCLGHPLIDQVRVVYQPAQHQLYEAAAAGLYLGEPIAGGNRRQESSHLALEALAYSPPQWVMIHDAARPLLDEMIITNTLKALEQSPAAIAAVRVSDTLKQAEPGGCTVEHTIDRQDVWCAQTPQAFHYQSILAAHRAFKGKALTDDAALAEQAGLAVTLVESKPDNFKLTTADDWYRATQIMERKVYFRTGCGFDVHRFADKRNQSERRLMLCGVAIAHDRVLEGHSDADVALHALTDALLGAVAAGDIGQHFPDSDPRWLGADSTIFLRHALGLLTASGGTIVNSDLTIICEQPSIGPHRRAMVARLAGLMQVNPGQVNVKATTCERMGFIGRSEGIAAQAVVTVKFAQILD